MSIIENIYISSSFGPREYIEKFLLLAYEFGTQALKKKDIIKLLELNRCPIELAEEICSRYSLMIPDDYMFGDPPKNFEDVSNRVKYTLKYARIEIIEEYFTKWNTKTEKGFIDRIIFARRENSEKLFEELLKEIYPIVDEIILENRFLAQRKIFIESKRKEFIEQNIFGVWPIDLILKFYEKEKSFKRLINRTCAIKKKEEKEAENVNR